MKDGDNRQGAGSSGVSRRSVLGVATAATLSGGQAPPPPADIKYNRKLMLGGGGIKGAYQAGMIQALFSSGFQPQSIYGVSVGGLNAAFLVDRHYFRATRKTVGDYFIALNETPPPGMDLAKPVDWPFIADELARFWRTKITSSRSIMRWRRTWTFAALFSRFNGFYDTAPLRQLLTSTLDPKRIARAELPMLAFAINLKTGQGEYFHEKMPNFLDAIVAGAAVPLLMPAIETAGQYGTAQFVDGALRQNIPLAIARVRGEKQATHLVCLACQAPREATTKLERGNLVKLIQKYAEIASEELLKLHIELLEHFEEKHGTKHIVLRPDTPVNIDAASGTAFDLDDFSPAQVDQLIKRGFADGMKQLRASAKFNTGSFRSS